MVWPPPVSTRPHTLFPSPALFRSGLDSVPNSSRNRVPPSASSKRPTRALVAPVKAPASWPNSSASIKVSGSAAQFMMTSGPSQREDRRWSRSATSHLPVRSEEHTSELQSLMRISYAVSCLTQKKNYNHLHTYNSYYLYKLEYQY